MKRFAFLALASAAFLGACSSSEHTQASSQNSTRNKNWNTSTTPNTANWNQADLQKSQHRGTQISKLEPEAQEWVMSTLPKGEHAELFGTMLGQWNTTMTWSAGPGTQPETSTGTATNTAAMQRFVQQEFQGEMFPGMTFQGFALFGFNDASGQYESVWCDNTSTAITNSTGAKQNDGSILWTGTFFDPASGQERTSKATLTFMNRNAMTYTVWDRAENGKEFASLTVQYTRDQTARTNNANTSSRTSQAQPASKKPWPTNLRNVAGVSERAD